jgi:tRNA pseudouridine55 synthase
MADSPRRETIHGVLNVLKPPGMTSHDAVSFVRRTLGTKRVGHTGTLDPAAAGVLPICIGQATRLVEYLQGGTKEYIAEATFGFETDTCDAVGKTVSEGDARNVNLERLRGVLDNFRGNITQTPPLHSAIKVGGKKLYELARAGETEVEIPTREVVISKLVVTRFVEDATRPRAMLHIECSGGTYIRSLVRDIGRVLGCGATMTFLVRTRSGAFSIGEASTLEAIAQDSSKAIIPITEVLGWCARRIIINDDYTHELSQGRLVEMKVPDRLDLEEYSRDHYAFKWRLTKVLHGGQGATSGHIVVINNAQTVAAIASPIADKPSFYKPDKVFFLDKSSDE